MGRNNRKIVLIILIIIILIVVGAVSTLFILMKNETIALTKEQKINKGIKEITKNIEQNFNIEKLENKVEKINSKLSRNTTTITAQANEFDMKYFTGYTYIEDEIKEMINQAQIQNVIEKDLDSNLINQKLSIKVGNVINSLTQEVIYNDEEMGIRIEELNNKYIFLNKEEAKNSYIFKEFTTIFNEIDSAEIKDIIEILNLTDSEKKYFIENYKEIITNNITMDMIKEDSITININGKEVKCSELSIVLNKIQISNILTQLIEKLEKDETGKSIISSKFKSFYEIDIYKLLNYLKSEVTQIDNSINLKIKVYCDYLKTYGYGFNINMDTNNIIINNLFKDNYNYIEIKTGDTIYRFSLENESLQFNGEIKDFEGNINILYNEKNGIGEGSITFVEKDENITKRILINTDFSKLDNSSVKLRVMYKDTNNDIDIAFNITNNTESINSVPKKLLNNENSVNFVSGTEEDMNEYIDIAFDNINKLLQNAANNSKLIHVYYRYFFDVITTQLGQYKNLIKTSVSQIRNPVGLLNEQMTQTEELVSKQNIIAFNAGFNIYEGEQKGSHIKTLYQSVQSSNLNQVDEEHVILWNCDYSMDEIENTKIYIVSFEYDIDGYINKIKVK